MMMMIEPPVCVFFTCLFVCPSPLPPLWRIWFIFITKKTKCWEIIKQYIAPIPVINKNKNKKWWKKILKNQPQLDQNIISIIFFSNHHLFFFSQSIIIIIIIYYMFVCLWWTYLTKKKKSISYLYSNYHYSITATLFIKSIDKKKFVVHNKFLFCFVYLYIISSSKKNNPFFYQ